MNAPRVLVTGASMGIGRALALAWASRGAHVVLSARGADALEDVAREVRAAGGAATAHAGDVTDEAYRAELVRRAGDLDVLVNNAGRGFRAGTLEIDLEELRRLFELNVYAPLRLVQLAAPRMARGSTVVMLSSIAGVVAAPRMGAYSASKFALEALAMAMRSELAEKGIDVVVVRPGPVATPFRRNSYRAPGERGYDRPDPRAQSAEEIARQTLRAVDASRAVVETSAYVRAASAAMRVVPPAVRLALRRMASRES